MDFEDLKVVWESQNEKPLYAINEDGLHSILRRNRRRFKRSIFLRDLREIGISLAMFLMLLYAGIPDYGLLKDLVLWEIVAMFTAAGLWLFYALYILVHRKRQESRERQYPSSLRGDLDREIAQTEYQIRMAKNILWWGLLPTGVAGLLGILVTVESSWARLLLILAVLLIMVGAELWTKKRKIKRDFLPRQRELESLRDKLADPEL